MLSILLTASFLKLLEYNKMENGIFMVLSSTKIFKKVLSYAKKVGGGQCHLLVFDTLSVQPLEYLGRSCIIVDSF